MADTTKMGHKAMLGMLDIQEIVKLDTAMNQEAERLLLRPTRRRRCSGRSSPIDYPIIVVIGGMRTLRSYVQGCGGGG